MHAPMSFFDTTVSNISLPSGDRIYVTVISHLVVSWTASRKVSKSCFLGFVSNSNIYADIDTMDNTLAGMASQWLICIMMINWYSDSMRMVTATSSMIIGAVILISIVIPWFLIGIVFIFIIYAYAAAFYRASARELKVRFFLGVNPFQFIWLTLSF